MPTTTKSLNAEERTEFMTEVRRHLPLVLSTLKETMVTGIETAMKRFDPNFCFTNAEKSQIQAILDGYLGNEQNFNIGYWPHSTYGAQYNPETRTIDINTASILLRSEGSATPQLLETLRSLPGVYPNMSSDQPVDRLMYLDLLFLLTHEVLHHLSFVVGPGASPSRFYALSQPSFPSGRSQRLLVSSETLREGVTNLLAILMTKEYYPLIGSENNTPYPFATLCTYSILKTGIATPRTVLDAYLGINYANAFLDAEPPGSVLVNQIKNNSNENLAATVFSDFPDNERSMQAFFRILSDALTQRGTTLEYIAVQAEADHLVDLSRIEKYIISRDK